MKERKFPKKLVLNKKTIATLSDDGKDLVRGGDADTVYASVCNYTCKCTFPLVVCGSIENCGDPTVGDITCPTCPTVACTDCYC